MATLQTCFLGSGTAFQDDGRGTAATLVESTGQAPFLVDAGPTLMQAAARYEVDLSPVERLFLTHLHGDHCAGWPFLLLHFVFRQGRERPLEVLGPHGTRRCLEGLLEHCYAGLGEKQGFSVQYRELERVPALEIEAGGGFCFDTLPMEHDDSSIGYRFHLQGQRIAFTGDTGWSSSLESLARGCDGLVLECTTLSPGPPGHVSLEELRERRGRLEVPRIVLVHTIDDVARQLALDPIPGVVAAQDGLRVDWV